MSKPVRHLKFPVVEGFPPRFPSDESRKCPICDSPFAGHGQIVYFSGGASIDHDAEKFKEDFRLSERMQGFLHAGIHTAASDCAVISIVRDSHCGQFDLTFCSTKCLADFFAEIVRQLEA